MDKKHQKQGSSQFTDVDSERDSEEDTETNSDEKEFSGERKSDDLTGLCNDRGGEVTPASEFVKVKIEELDE